MQPKRDQRGAVQKSASRLVLHKVQENGGNCLSASEVEAKLSSNETTQSIFSVLIPGIKAKQNCFLALITVTVPFSSKVSRCMQDIHNSS